MLSQDSSAYPCVIYAKVHFKGKVNPQAMEQAVTDMLQIHPLLQARLAGGSGLTRWNLEDMPQCAVTWTEAPPDEHWAEDRFVNLRKESGLRVHIHNYVNSENQPHCCMFIGVHHACTDGLGLLNAIEDLCAIYHARLNNEAAKLRNRVVGLLEERNRFGLNARKILRLLPKHAVGLLGVRQFLMRKPVPLLPQPSASLLHAPKRSILAIRHTFGRDSTSTIQAIATGWGVTLNELLACSIFEGIAEFRAQRQAQRPEDWLRMMIPVNMRNHADDFKQSACNIVSSVFLDRTPQQIANSVELLKSIHDEMELIKRNRLALIFSYSLWFRSKLNRGRPTPIPAERCQTTLVFTNLGKPFRKSPALNAEHKLTAGDLTLETVELLAPLAPLVAAAFSVIYYSKCLHLSLRYDQRVLDTPAAESLLAAVCGKLHQWQERAPRKLEC